MKNKKAERLLIFLQRSQMHLYKESGSKIETWSFDPTLISDLEILDEDKFRSAIDVFVNQQKIGGGEAIVLLDNSVYFTQKVVGNAAPAENQENGDSVEKETEEPGLIEKVNLEEEEKLRFMHSMPFSNVFATVLAIGKEKLIFSLNRDFYEPFIKEFTDRKYEVTYIYPILVVNEFFGEAGFTAATANAFIQSADKFKAYNFLQAPLKKEIGPTPSSTIMPDNSERKRLYMLVGGFVLLLLVLVAVILWSRARDAADLAKIPVQNTSGTVAPVQELAAPVVTPVLTPGAPAVPIDNEPVIGGTASASAEFGSLKVVVRNGTGTAAEGETLQQRLLDLGFSSSTLTNIPQQSADSTIIIVKPTVSNDVKQVLQTELINLGYDVTFQESAEVSDDISINLTSQ